MQKIDIRAVDRAGGGIDFFASIEDIMTSAMKIALVCAGGTLTICANSKAASAAELGYWFVPSASGGTIQVDGGFLVGDNDFIVHIAGSNNGSSWTTLATYTPSVDYNTITGWGFDSYAGDLCGWSHYQADVWDNTTSQWVVTNLNINGPQYIDFTMSGC